MRIVGLQGWGALALVALLSACGGDDAERADGEGAPEVVSEDMVADAPGSPGTDVDRRIFQETVDWALSVRLDTVPIGRSMARIGERFVGTPYVPGTLEQQGEPLVVNLRELDCVTFVENVLALARVIRAGEPEWNAFLAELERIRYRDGTRDGYPSRLHYFSEWISNNQELGLVRNVTQELGGVRDPEVIDFMTENADKYPALADDPAMVEAIRQMEARINQEPRYYIPEDDLAESIDQVEEGDIIAATSAVPGLDIAHTGIAVLRGDRIHLMHAPLVGDSVEVSEQPLVDRIQRIEGQDGIMVARPL